MATTIEEALDQLCLLQGFGEQLKDAVDELKKLAANIETESKKTLDMLAPEVSARDGLVPLRRFDEVANAAKRVLEALAPQLESVTEEDGPELVELWGACEALKEALR